MNCIILTANGNGSELLCNFLRKTKYFNHYRSLSTHPNSQKKDFEIMAPNRHVDPWHVLNTIKTKEFCKDYFKIKTSVLQGDKPFIIKIPIEHYEYYNSPDRSFIEENIPNPKYIWFKRENKAARAMSVYFKFSEQIRYEELLNTYFSLADEDWTNFLHDVDYLEIEYEDLVSSPTQMLNSCLDFLELPRTEIEINFSRDSQYYVKELDKLSIGML